MAVFQGTDALVSNVVDTLMPPFAGPWTSHKRRIVLFTSAQLGAPKTVTMAKRYGDAMVERAFADGAEVPMHEWVVRHNAIAKYPQIKRGHSVAVNTEVPTNPEALVLRLGGMITIDEGRMRIVGGSAYLAHGGVLIVADKGRLWTDLLQSGTADKGVHPFHRILRLEAEGGVICLATPDLSQSITAPCRFVFVGIAPLCPCGKYGRKQRPGVASCTCSEEDREAWIHGVSLAVDGHGVVIG